VPCNVPATFLVDSLAAYRLVRLVTTDSIFDRPRDAAMAALSERHPMLVELLGCEWCVGVWVSAAVVAADVAAPRAWRPVGRALAVSTLVGLIASRADA
jgi:hypothetical protein